MGPDFPFHFIIKISLTQTVMFLVKNGSQTKVSQGLVFLRDVHVPGFEFIYLGPRAGEEKNAFLFSLSPSA